MFINQYFERTKYSSMSGSDDNVSEIFFLILDSIEAFEGQLRLEMSSYSGDGVSQA